MSEPDVDLTAEEEAQLEELQGRDKKGRFVRKPTVVIQQPPAAVSPSDEPNPLVEKFAERLKAELGDKYNPKLDAMPVDQRIATMEILLDNKEPKPPIKKEGEGGDIGVPPPTVSTKPKTFLELQNENQFKQKLRDKGSYLEIAKNLYK